MKQEISERWMPLETVYIPPITWEGYRENVLAREIWGTPVTAPVGIEDAYLIRCATNERIDLCKDEFIIGKSREADYTIEGNKAISRKHVKIWKNGGAYLLEDLDSLNHTYVDEMVIKGTVEIQSGQLIKLADEAFAFYINKVEK